MSRRTHRHIPTPTPTINVNLLGMGLLVSEADVTTEKGTWQVGERLIDV